MATLMHAKVRPQITGDYGATSKQRTIGVGVALVGLTLAVITLIAHRGLGSPELARSSRQDPEDARHRQGVRWPDDARQLHSSCSTSWSPVAASRASQPGSPGSAHFVNWHSLSS